MPEMCLPIRITGIRSLPALLLLLVSAALGGCSGGDFGRTRSDFRNDDMHRWLGAEATGSIGMTPSQFQLTENERQLRDQAYPLIEPPHSRPAWRSVFGDYAPISSPWRQSVAFDRTAYGRQLIDEPHRSHSSRYAQLIEDVRNDITRFEPFYATAIRVIASTVLYGLPKTNTFDVRKMIRSSSTKVRIFSRYFHSTRCWRKFHVRPQAQNGRRRYQIALKPRGRSL